MKSKILSIFVCLIAIWMLIFCISKFFLPNLETVTITKQEPLVYITTYGEKYHSEWCHYLKQSSHPIGREKAIKQGYLIKVLSVLLYHVIGKVSIVFCRFKEILFR